MTTQPTLETLWTPAEASRIMSDWLDRARAKRARTAARNANHRTAMLARMMTEGISCKENP